jgi:hypothetical protein
MPRYRIHRMKESPRENFRWAPHTGGLAVVKPKDYDLDEEVEASTPYAVWKSLLAEGRPLRPGDLLETSHVDGVPGQLHITKYIGFEPASWYVPEPRPGCDTSSAEIPEATGMPLQSDSV